MSGKLIVTGKKRSKTKPLAVEGLMEFESCQYKQDGNGCGYGCRYFKKLQKNMMHQFGESEHTSGNIYTWTRNPTVDVYSVKLEEGSKKCKLTVKGVVQKDYSVANVTLMKTNILSIKDTVEMMFDEDHPKNKK